MKTEELIEGYLVYTDNGIERVHWCNVNGVKELVSPKGKVYGYVPDYFEVKRLQEQIKEANEVIKEYGKFNNWGEMTKTNTIYHILSEKIMVVAGK